jgi:DNA topoisomerase-1
MPGIRRRRAGANFSYRCPDGGTIRDAEEIRRIKALAIPPAWTDVWICPDPCGHIQATGRDARGRKQYRYHSRYRAAREEAKYGHLIAFARTLPRIRRRISEDLALPGLTRERVLAVVVSLLDTTHIRVGNEEYARQNGSFGLTTLRDRHARICGSIIRFRFRAKSGKIQEVGVHDRRLARVVQRCQDLPGQQLFQYLNGDGEPHGVESGDVNAYLREISGAEITAKDFRTWAGTVLAAQALAERGPGESEGETRRNILDAIDAAAARLNNTRAVCRSCYVHPAVFDAYERGVTLADFRPRRAANPRGLTPAEASVLALLVHSVARAA